MKFSPAEEQRLMTEFWDPAIADDPYEFVKFAYPWKKANTPLWNCKGPRTWQRDDLQEIAAHIKEQKARIELGLDPKPFRKATASGRGTGKSAKISWLADWNRSCHVGSTTIITANTEPQLRNKTFAEINRWHTMALNAHWFVSQGLTIKPAPWFEKAVKEQLLIDCTYYYVQGQLWSEENPDAFAGAHNQYGMMVLMDEASGIPNALFDVTSGFFTDPILHRYWDVDSNPRRNSGAFYSAFHENANFWKHRQLDSRTVEGIDKDYLDEIITIHGIESDTVRVEVLGQFPKAGVKQFIANDAVYGAQQREDIQDLGAGLVMGMDVARFGDDWNVIRFRQGRNGRVLKPIRWQGMDTVQSAERAAEVINLYRPDLVNIDAGQGTGVIDILRSKKYKVSEVWFGSKAEDKEWANKRTEMYARARNWLPGGCIDKSPLLFTDLTAVDYDFFGKAKDQIILQSKDVFKAAQGRSPDDGDAFALTFAGACSRRDTRASRFTSGSRVAADVDYPLFG